MNDELAERIKGINDLARTLMKVPASEQFMGNMQSIISCALLEIKLAIELLAKQQQNKESNHHN